MTSDFKKIIPALVQGNIKFIVIGGVAAIVQVLLEQGSI
jgi:hypothetical protein